MSFELKRKERRVLEVKLGEDVLKVDIYESLAKYKAYIQAQHRITLLNEKLQKLQTTNNVTDEFFEIYTSAVIAMLENIFTAEDVKKILVFFENNADEALEQLVPFITGEYVQAMEEERAKRSKAKLETL